MKKFVSALMIISFALFSTSFKYAHPQKVLKLDCVAAAIIDQNSGRILYSKNKDKLLPMASTTKIMTAIIALERGKATDEVLVSKRAARITGSTVGLKAGEKLKLEELLYGLLLKSGNDCAVTIAEYIGGSVEAFSELMNQKAMNIGALSTHFSSPHGLDNYDHFTTAEDLARIAAYAMKNRIFSKIVATRSIVSGVTGAFTRAYNNTNKMLYRLDSYDGVKTGYTGNAGKCLVASFKHNGRRVICSILNSSNRWLDAEKMVDYACDNFAYIKLYDKNQLIKKITIYGGKVKSAIAVTKEEIWIPLRKEELNQYKAETFISSMSYAPLIKNEILGNLVVSIKGTSEMIKYPLVSSVNVEYFTR